MPNVRQYDQPGATTRAVHIAAKALLYFALSMSRPISEQGIDLLAEREHAFPGVFHADNVPAGFICLGQ
jgi:hypothetical protein